MKLTTNKTDLAQALTNITGVISPRTTLPILGNVLMRASNGELELIATDLDMSLSVKIKADVEVAGDCTLPAKRLTGVIRESPAQEVSIAWDQVRADIQSGGSRVKLIGLPASEFPDRIPPVDSIATFTLSCEAIGSIIRRAAHAASTDESRYVLNGLLIESTGDGLIFIATDGRRLAKVEMPMEGYPAFMAIIPNKTISLLQRVLGLGDCAITLYPSEIVFTLDGASLYSKLIDGNFPNWRQVMPRDSGQKVTVEREVLMAAVKRVGLMVNEKTNSITFAFSENQVTVSGNSPDVGEAEETVECQCGVSVRTAMNPHYVLQLLSGLRCDTVAIALLDDSSPIVFSDEAFQSVIMPMRVAQ